MDGLRIFKWLGTAAILMPLSCGLAMRPGMIGEDAFAAQAIRMDVTGRGGWIMNKVVRFGSFRTDPFDLGWTKIDRSDGKQGWVFGKSNETHIDARNRFAFRQFDSSGAAVDVRCSASRKITTTRYRKSYTSEEIQEDRYEIEISGKDWTRTAIFPMGLSPGVSAAMALGRDTLRLVHEKKRDLDKKLLFEGVLFKRGEETLGAVNLYHAGAVWLKHDLDGEEALVLAALATALLTKPDFENVE
ncbi:MAG TPA: hypothetical protein VJ385_20240 [Fibrobacteria bacterium]|nr:hypothetical protein [Fibrobacteria bacterium]